MKSDIERTVKVYCTRLDADPNHRFRSWGHCYRYFKRFRRLASGRDYDHAALQLGFYLASWGMYRGSAFLLWKDFKIHRPVVKELVKSKYDPLLGLSFSSMKKRTHIISLMVSLATSIRGIYTHRIETVNGTRDNILVSDRLVTKIMLATLACIPAYDKYVVKGMRSTHLSYSRLNGKHLESLFEWCESQRSHFKALRSLRENGLRYPLMKLVDMYFWEKGRLLIK